MLYGFSEVNSGGHYLLFDSDVALLRQGGWIVTQTNNGFGSCYEGYLECASLKEAREAFGSILHIDPDYMACSCCGPSFSWNVYGEEEEL